MAKGNLFLGLARGSVGDVTMYRRDGNQVSRARVRKIANPKSQGQVYTRAILSTVAKAYSAGKVVFDHSFENYPVPEGAQRRFLKLNMDALRARVYDDIENQTDALYSSPLVGPNSPSPVAGEFIVSEGSLSQPLILITESTADDRAYITFGQPSAGETMGDFFNRLGIVQGDIFTIIFLASGDVMAGLTPKTAFAWIQFEVGQFDPTAVASQTYIDDVFRMAKSSNITGGELLTEVHYIQFGGDVAFTDMNVVFIDGIGLSAASPYFNGTFAVIRSRKNSPLRSSAQMKWVIGDDHGGLAWSQIVDAWTGAYQLGESDLLLEGSEFPRQSQAVVMTANFAQPTGITALYEQALHADAPELSLSRSVSVEEFASHLGVNGNPNLALEFSGNQASLIDATGGDPGAYASLTLDGSTIAVVASASTGPSGFSFFWQ